MQSFKDQFSFEHRFAEANRIRTKHALSIPVVFQSIESSKSPIVPVRLIIPGSVCCSQLNIAIRRRMKDITQEMGIFLFVGDTNFLVPGASTLDSLYQRCRDADGMLYITVAVENAFGNHYT